MSESKPVVINRETLVPIGVAAGLLIPLFLFYNWIGGKIDSQGKDANAKLESIDRRLENIERARDGVMLKASFEAWALRLSRDNAALKVPEFHQ